MANSRGRDARHPGGLRAVPANGAAGAGGAPRQGCRRRGANKQPGAGGIGKADGAKAKGGKADQDKREAKVGGIKIHDTRMVRLMQVLLHVGTRIHGWRGEQIRQAVVAASGIKPEDYTPNQVRYDLRKMRAHGLLERDGKRYAYRLTDNGVKAAAIAGPNERRRAAGVLAIAGETKPLPGSGSFRPRQRPHRRG
jgi:hypothetical protein